MDRRALVLLFLLPLACTKPSSSRRPTTLAKGSLAYAATITAELIVVAELRNRFELVAYDRETHREKWRRDIGPADYDISALASDARFAWVASLDGTLRTFDLRDGAARTGWNLGAPATAVAVAPSGAFFATGTTTGVVCLRRMRDAALLHCVAGHDGGVTDLSFHDSELASSGTKGVVTVWSLPSMHRRRRTVVQGSANAIAHGPSGTIAIATSSQPLVRTPAIARAEESGFVDIDRAAKVVLWKSGGEMTPLLGHRAPVTDVVWADGSWLSSSWDRTVRSWSGARSRVVATFSYLVRDLAAAPGLWVACSWARTAEKNAVQVFLSNHLAAD